MKLLTRTNIYFISITLIVFALGGQVFFARVHSINKFDAEERLDQEKNKILTYIKLNHGLPKSSITLGDSVAFSIATNENREDKKGHIKLLNRAENEYEPFRTLEFTISDGDQLYKAIIYRPLLESDDLTTAIVQAMLIIGACLLVVLLLSNFIISKIMWRPFYSTLQKIKSFELAKEGSIVFDASEISEFGELNNVLQAMTDKMSLDYRNLKEFTENASHEIQTPLAVIQSKLELLIQSQNLSAEQAENVKAIYESASRLSRLNQALLLLAKIENHQFVDSKEMPIHELMAKKLNDFEELIEHKKLALEKHLNPLVVSIHPILVDILLNNLISNAIKHNWEGGKLDVEIKEKQLIVRNSGMPLSIPTEAIFERFKKAHQSSDSLGLGLAIVKEICHVYGFTIRYDFIDAMHTITVGFR